MGSRLFFLHPLCVLCGLVWFGMTCQLVHVHISIHVYECI